MRDIVNTDLFGYDPAKPRAASLPSRQAQLGQYLTSDSVSAFMAGLFPALLEHVRLLDAGAGKGALTVAFVKRWREEVGAGGLSAHCFEIDELMLGALQSATQSLGQLAGVSTEIFQGDFVQSAATMLRLGKGTRYTHAILNPPYKKIATASDHRAFMRMAGLETVNLYAGFVGLSLALMEKGGELVAIVPRSFCNGPYYQPFRQFILDRAAIGHIHLFESRNKAFKHDGVLQENIIIRLTRAVQQGNVTISASTDDSFSDYTETVRPFSCIVAPSDLKRFIHIPTAGTDLLDHQAFRFQLDELGLSVSTGPVVDFRLRDYLLANPEPGAVPLLYPGHFTADGLGWPKLGFKKPNAIRHTDETTKWLFPSGFYVVVRRFSSKEERRRIVANVVDPAALPAKMIGFENHLNVIHDRRRALPEDVARGIAMYLNATTVDRYFRQFSGHTQVNAADLRTIHYPSCDAIIRLGKWAKEQPRPSQQAIDERVAELA